SERLKGFRIFVENKYHTDIDNLITKIKEGSQDPYDILNSYIAYTRSYNNISTLTLKQRIITVKNFLEYFDVDISQRKFKLKVKLPRIVRKNKEALSKEEITDILNACSD